MNARNDECLVKIALPASLLRQLFTEQQLCAHQLRCLDPASKQIVRRLCLSACARHLAGYKCRADQPATVPAARMTPLEPLTARPSMGIDNRNANHNHSRNVPA